MNKDKLTELLTKVKENQIDVPDALHALKNLTYDNLGYARVDRSSPSDSITIQRDLP